MPTSLVEGASLLAVDVGATTTRAALFDVVEGTYRFVALGAAPSSAEAPASDIGLGVREAIEKLQAISGRAFLNKDRALILPGQPDGSGVDAFAATLSAGQSLRTVIVGLLADVSLESARRLAETTYARIVENIDLTDHRRADAQIDALLRARPDLIVITGGTDGGASRSVQKMLEAVGLACYLMPAEKRPAILFAGNQKLNDEVKELVGQLTPALHFSSNVRPSLETEDLDPASFELAQLFTRIRRGQLRGVEELEGWSRGHIYPSAYALGRMIRFLSSGSESGVLGIDLGASAATIAAGFNGKLTLRAYPQFGMGEHLNTLQQHTDLEAIARWLTLDIPSSTLRDYLYQKSTYPSILPATAEDAAMSQAIARQTLHLATRKARQDFPAEVRSARPDLLPFLELISASGGSIVDAPTPGQSLLLLLDALQPVGLTHFMLDRSGLLPLLGAAAGHNNLLPVQVLDSGILQNLGTVISVVSRTAYGNPVLRVRLNTPDKNEVRIEVKQGSLEMIPLAAGQSAKLTVQPLHRAEAGFGAGRAQTIPVSGGALGVVIDARGRPLQLSNDAVRRRELLKKWLWTLGG